MNIVKDIIDTVKTGCDLKISYEPISDKIAFELHDTMSDAHDVRLVRVSELDYCMDAEFIMSVILKKMLEDIEVFNANLIKEEM